MNTGDKYSPLEESYEQLSEATLDVSTSLSQLLKEMEEAERKRFFLIRFIDSKIPSLFGYRTGYVILRPFLIMKEIWMRIVWAWQRVFRGWDDTVLWYGIDNYLSNLIPQLIYELLENKNGLPAIMIPDMENDMSEYAYQYYFNCYRVDLIKIAQGFEAYNKMTDVGYESEEYHKLEKQFEEAFPLFKKYFGTLWS